MPRGRGAKHPEAENFALGLPTKFELAIDGGVAVYSLFCFEIVL